MDIINHVKPTALLGLSTLKVRIDQCSMLPCVTLTCTFQNAFTEDVVKTMSAFNARPIIFPLSNPVHLSELDYQNAIAW